MQNTLNERLKEYLEVEKISAPNIYNKIGVSRTNWFGWISQNKAIPLNKVQAIIALLPNINARWLLTGEGEMLVGSETPRIGYKENDCLRKAEEPGGCLVCAEKERLIEMQNKHIEYLELSLGKKKKTS